MTHTLYVRVPQATYDALADEAAEEGEQLAVIVRRVLRRHVKQEARKQ